jgi:hypothetical protein
VIWVVRLGVVALFVLFLWGLDVIREADRRERQRAEFAAMKRLRNREDLCALCEKPMGPDRETFRWANGSSFEGHGGCLSDFGYDLWVSQEMDRDADESAFREPEPDNTIPEGQA